MAEREPEQPDRLERPDRVERDVFIAARPEIVFGFLTESEKFVRWMGIEARLEARSGGAFRVNVDGANIAAGRFVEVTPYRRVVFTWGWEGGEALPPGASTVEITLTESTNGTLLRLAHSGLSVELAPSHGAGWDHFMARLECRAGGGDPGPDPWIKDDAAAG